MSACEQSIGHDRLPRELWSMIFTLLPLKDISAVTLSCRLFHTLAQPLLFRPYTLRPFIVPSEAARFDISYFVLCGPLRITSRDSTELHAALTFIGSERIARRVRQVRMCRPQVEDGLGSTAYTDGHVVVIRLFEVLPSLQNLHTLELWNVGLGPSHISDLCQLRALESLTFGWCHVLYGRPFQLQVSSFIIPSFTHTSTGYHCERWLSFVQPQKISTLHLPYFAELVGLLFERLLSMGPFEHLQSLYIPRVCTWLPHFVSALRSCPGLRELRVHNDSSSYGIATNRSIIPSDVIPCLECFSGPDELLFALADERPFVQIALWGLKLFHASDPDYLLPPLLQVSATVQSLHIYVFFLTYELLTTVSGRFQGLKRLYANILVDDRYPRDGVHERASLFQSLPSVLPESLESLCVQSNFLTFEDDDELHEAKCLEELTSLRSRCSHLRDAFVAHAKSFWTWKLGEKMTSHPSDRMRLEDVLYKLDVPFCPYP